MIDRAGSLADDLIICAYVIARKSGGQPFLHGVLTGPVAGLISGVVIGLFSWIATKIVRKP